MDPPPKMNSPYSFMERIMNVLYAFNLGCLSTVLTWIHYFYLVTVGGESRWLSKKTIESESQNNSPKVAKPIPKVTLVKKRKKSWTPKNKKTVQSYSKKSDSEISSADKSISNYPAKNNTPRKYPGRPPKKSVAKSPVGRTKTSGKSPKNSVSQENAIEESAKKTIVTKAAKGKKGAVATTPVRLSASINSPAPSRGSGRVCI